MLVWTRLASHAWGYACLDTVSSGTYVRNQVPLKYRPSTIPEWHAEVQLVQYLPCTSIIGSRSLSPLSSFLFLPLSAHGLACLPLRNEVLTALPAEVLPTHLLSLGESARVLVLALVLGTLAA